MVGLGKSSAAAVVAVAVVVTKRARDPGWTLARAQMGPN